MKKLVANGLITLFIVLIIATIGQSCGKDDPIVPPPPPPPPTPTDTLSAGWKKIYVDSSTFLVDIAFPTSQIGYVCGDRYVGKSIDGGLTWTKINFPDSLIGHFSFLFFKDENTGWVTTQNSILRTIDGGASWKKTLLSNSNDIQFVTSSVGYVATQTGLYKSIDGGASYQKLAAAGSVFHSGVYFFDENNGWITRSGSILATQDGGANFNKQTDIGTGEYYNILFIDANNGCTSGAGTSYIWFTKNGGTSWDKIGNLGTQNDVHFFNNNEGYISNNSDIFRTANGGTTLTREVHSLKPEIIETCFTDANHGWATAGAYIFRLSK